MLLKNIFSFFVLVFFIYLINENSLYSYINKGSGSDFFQLFLSFFVAIGTFFKNIFNKNKNSKDKYE